MIAGTPAGIPVHVVAWRNGREHTSTVTLDEAQQQARTGDRKTVNDYVDLIEATTRQEYTLFQAISIRSTSLAWADAIFFRSVMPDVIYYEETVELGAMALHVFLLSNPDLLFSDTYLETAIKWAVRNEMEHRAPWLCR